MVQQSLMGQGLLINEAPQSHSDTQRLAGLCRTSDEPNTETCAWEHTTLTRDRYPCPRRDLNLQSQQASGRRPTPWTVQPLGSGVALQGYIWKLAVRVSSFMMLVPCVTISHFSYLSLTSYGHSLVTALCLPQNWAIVRTIIPSLFIERRSWIKPWVYHTYEIQEQLVEAWHYKPGGRRFNSRWCHSNFSLT